MTKPRKRKPAAKRVATVTAEKGETKPEAMVRALVDPYLRHGVLSHAVADKAFGKLPGEPTFDDFGRAMQAKAKAAMTGDLTMATELLTAQALSLDALFGELARRAAMNMGDYPVAAERYARLAFKAQSNSRAAIEALAKLHQPREQVLRHVHVNEGGQAVIANNINQHGGGGMKNGKTNEQPHATSSACEGQTMLGQDAAGNGVPISSGEGESAMQDARRKGKRCA